MDPFDILGIKPTKDFHKIKSAYKSMLIATHPDKMNGDAKYFMLVHDAYKSLNTLYKVKERNLPNTNVKYNAREHQRPQQQKPKKMGNEQFNSFFEKNKICANDPFSRGYGNRMSERVNYQEDAAQLSRTQLNIPRNKVVVYTEPKPVSQGWTDNFEQLGVDNIDDFSTTNSTDYMRAYSHPEEQVDTVQRHKNIDALQATRSNTDFTLSEKEKHYYARKQEERRRLEIYQSRKFNEDKQRIHDRYTQLHERLGWSGYEN